MLREDNWENENGGWLKGRGEHWEGITEVVIGMEEFMEEKVVGVGDGTS